MNQLKSLKQECEKRVDAKAKNSIDRNIRGLIYVQKYFRIG